MNCVQYSGGDTDVRYFDNDKRKLKQFYSFFSIITNKKEKSIPRSTVWNTACAYVQGKGEGDHGDQISDSNYCTKQQCRHGFYLRFTITAI